MRSRMGLLYHRHSISPSHPFWLLRGPSAFCYPMPYISRPRFRANNRVFAKIPDGIRVILYVNHIIVILNLYSLISNNTDRLVGRNNTGGVEPPSLGALNLEVSAISGSVSTDNTLCVRKESANRLLAAFYRGSVSSPRVLPSTALSSASLVKVDLG